MEDYDENEVAVEESGHLAAVVDGFQEFLAEPDSASAMKASGSIGGLDAEK